LKQETGKRHECAKPGLKRSHTKSSPSKRARAHVQGFICKNVPGRMVYNGLELETTLGISNKIEKLHCSVFIQWNTI
jgi:hypothetical protein